METIELYNRFMHGENGRREFMNGIQRYAIGGLAATTILAVLMPDYASGQQCLKATIEFGPPMRPCHLRKGTEASKGISCAL
jgi:hypothetical protein